VTPQAKLHEEEVKKKVERNWNEGAKLYLTTWIARPHDDDDDCLFMTIYTAACEAKNRGDLVDPRHRPAAGTRRLRETAGVIWPDTPECAGFDRCSMKERDVSSSRACLLYNVASAHP